MSSRYETSLAIRSKIYQTFQKAVFTLFLSMESLQNSELKIAPGGKNLKIDKQSGNVYLAAKRKHVLVVEKYVSCQYVSITFNFFLYHLTILWHEHLIEFMSSAHFNSETPFLQIHNCSRNETIFGISWS